jgi:L-amino acid N-acyltransferase YncA
MSSGEIDGRYPKQVSLRDGREVSVRLMNGGDRQGILDFAGSLPEGDLLFLRTDICDPAIVDAWIGNVEKELSTTLVAEANGQLAAYASLHREGARWTRNVGEIRINVAPSYRRSGLGRVLAEEIFWVARKSGVRKITAQMTPDQPSARATFERLGFQVEALLSDWVEDRRGRPHDLLVMTYDLQGFTDQMEEPLAV